MSADYIVDIDYFRRTKRLICTVCKECIVEMDEMSMYEERETAAARQAIQNHRCTRPIDVEKKYGLYRYEGAKVVRWCCADCHVDILSVKREALKNQDWMKMVTISNRLREEMAGHVHGTKHGMEEVKGIRVVRFKKGEVNEERQSSGRDRPKPKVSRRGTSRFAKRRNALLGYWK